MGNHGSLDYLKTFWHQGAQNLRKVSRVVALYNLQCGFFSTSNEETKLFQLCIFSPMQPTSFFNLERKQFLNPYFKRTNRCLAKILLAYRPPFPKEKQKIASIKHVIPKYSPSLPYCVTQGIVSLNRSLSIRFWVTHAFSRSQIPPG